MNEKILKQLESELLKENSKITLGDTSKTTIFKMFKQDDMPLENILISLYNMAKISQYKSRELENNLNLLANRVYKTNEDFTQVEKSEISEALRVLEVEQLKDIENCRDYLHDNLYIDLIMGEEEPNYEEIENQREMLMNKIKYPTPSMYATFKELVNNEIMGRKCK